MSNKYDDMGKDGLRSACRKAGISYGKLNNQGMRDALRQIPVIDSGPKTNLERAIEHDKRVADNNEEQIHIGSNLSAEPTAPAKQTEAPVALGSTEFRSSPEAQANAKSWEKVTSKKTSTSGFKIEKEREEKNGVKRPSIGGMCRAVWDALDAVVTAGGSPTAKDVKAMSEKNSWNVNNASIEFYNWRRFNGISGRKTKKA